jgi:hypothetical protein
MTSPLRRKHRTTVLKSHPKTGIDARRSGLWRTLLGNLSQPFQIGLLTGVAAVSCCQLSWSDDFRHAGRLGRVEPARIRISDAKPLNAANEESDLGTPPSDSETEASTEEQQPTPKAGSVDQANAWRLRWRQPQSVAPVTPVVNRPTIAKASHTTKTAKSNIPTKAVLSWNESEVAEPSHVRLVAQFTPADPLHDPFGGEPARHQADAETLETIVVSQPGQAQPGQAQPGPGAKPAKPGARSEGIDSSPFPGTQLQPNDSRLVPGGNRPIPPTNLPTPNNDSPFPADDRPQPAEQPPALDPDRPTLPDAQPPVDLTPKLDFSPDMTDPAPQPKAESTDPLADTPKPNGTDEKKVPCDRTYNRRNCCTEEGKCNNAREKIRAYTITRVHLDISPLFTNTDLELTTEAMMAKTLADAPSRTWTDRTGRQLAQGRIQDFRHGRVIVETDSGEVVRIPFHELSDDDLCFFTAWWSIPTECSLANDEYIPRDWLCMNLNWKASSLCHKPLYFEEVALERYGHSTGPFTQPFISTAHFFGSLVTLPYQMGMHPPQECQYVLGYYRPGSCAPWLVPPFPVSWRGALAEAGAVVGGIYIIP